MYELRTMMINCVYDFRCTFAQLAARPGVAEKWRAHIFEEERGDVPRQQWIREASEAVELLRSKEFAQQPVRFVVEAQMLLNDVYQVRKHMHEPYKGLRADTDVQLHKDMLSETHKVAKAAQQARDADSALKAAVGRGDVEAAARLLPEATAAERVAAFVVACARARGALLAALPALGAGGVAARAWGEAWQRAAHFDAAAEMGEGVVEALLAGAEGAAGGGGGAGGRGAPAGA